MLRSYSLPAHSLVLGSILSALSAQVALANQPPVASNDSVTTRETRAVSVNVTANDSDPDGDAIRLVFGNPVIVAAVNGTTARASDSTILYTPDTGFTGVDTFRYRITDGSSVRSAVVTVTVVTNQQPVAQNDSATTGEGQAVSIHVTANDTDPEGDPVRLVNGNPVIEAAVNGITSRLSDSTILYTPNAGFFGTDSFRYRITDGFPGSVHSAVVTVTVTPSNLPPLASNDSASTRESTAVTVNVLANDSDPDGDAIRLVFGNPVIVAAANGTTVRASDTSITYTPSAGFSGTDSFRYRITDGTEIDSAVVTVSVANNAQPIAMPDRKATPLDIPVTINVTANDSDPEGDTIRLVNDPIIELPTQGTATRVSDSSIRYTPNAGFNGTDTFRYRITDGFPSSLHSAIVTVRVDNKLPNALPETVETHANTAIAIHVTANDSDPDRDTVVLVSNPILTPPTQGTAFRLSDTSITYTPSGGFIGTDSFRYRITDGWGAFHSAVVTVRVTNNSPVARNDNATTNVDTAVTIDVVANDSDPDGDGISVTAIVSQPANGSATRLNGREVRYTPRTGFAGSDSFTYSLRDDLGATATGRVDITVLALPEPVVTAVERDPIRRGQIKTIIVRGSNLQNANVYVAAMPIDEGEPTTRVYPSATLRTINSAGTRLEARIDATNAGVDGFYNLAIDTPGGSTAAQFRVVGPEPVIDMWTPSEPIAGRIHILQVAGVNLAGADVVPMTPGVMILDLDNSDDRALTGLMFVSSSVPLGDLDIRLDGQGGSIMLPMNLRPDIPSTRLPTTKIDTKGALPGGVTPQIYYQDPVSPHILAAGVMGKHLNETEDLPNTISSAQRARAKMFEICFSISLRARFSFSAVLISLLDDFGDPLVQEAVNALVPGQKLDFNSLTLAVSGFIEFEFFFRICNTGVTDLRFCIRGGIAVIVPAIGGFARTFDLCFGINQQDDLPASGRVNSHTYSTTNGCAEATDLNPGSFTGDRDGELRINCCEQATISLQTSLLVFETPIVVAGPVLDYLPMCVEPPTGSGVFRLFLDIDDDNGFDPNNAVPIGDLDDLAGYVPGTTTSGASVGDLSMSPQRMKLVAAYVDIQGGSAQVVPPPSGVTDVSFILTNTSAFVGVASNWPISGGSTAPDFHLGTGSAQMTRVFGSDHTARVDFVAKDYGGFTTVEASPDGGVTRQVVRIPKDESGNMLPDAGWRTNSGTLVSSGSLVANADTDFLPATASANPANGGTGDGLSVFEEYRGFMVRGKHRRTHPNGKDVFISSNLANGIAYAFPSLPLTVHRISGQDEAQANEYNAMRDINFNQMNSGSGGNVPGHSLQKAVRGLGLMMPPAGIPSCVLGAKFPLTVPETPNETTSVQVYLTPHNTASCLAIPASAITGELRRTFGHEVGHALHLCHKSGPCADPRSPGVSIMSCPPFPGANGSGSPASQYDALDVAQIRVHVKHP